MPAEHVTLAVSCAPDTEARGGWRRWQGDLVFELDRGLTVGYPGFYACEL